MKFFSSILPVVLATGALAMPSAVEKKGLSSSNPFSPIPGYPLGNGYCLSDAQAGFITNLFYEILTTPNRAGANFSSQTLISTNYVETSDSINTLAGYPLGGGTFVGKEAFINGVVNAQNIPAMQTLAFFHDCTNIAWRWTITGLGSNQYEIKGINHFVANPLTGQLDSNSLEFNSIAWGRDVGWTCTPPS